MLGKTHQNSCLIEDRCHEPLDLLLANPLSHFGGTFICIFCIAKLRFSAFWPALRNCWYHWVFHFPQAMQQAAENADYSGIIDAHKVTYKGEIALGRAKASAISGNSKAFTFLSHLLGCLFFPPLQQQKPHFCNPGQKAVASAVLSSKSCLSHLHWECTECWLWCNTYDKTVCTVELTVPNLVLISTNYLLKHSLIKIIFTSLCKCTLQFPKLLMEKIDIQNFLLFPLKPK